MGCKIFVNILAMGGYVKISAIKYIVTVAGLTLVLQKAI
jgi:hypothetical protein